MVQGLKGLDCEMNHNGNRGERSVYDKAADFARLQRDKDVGGGTGAFSIFSRSILGCLGVRLGVKSCPTGGEGDYYTIPQWFDTSDSGYWVYRG